MGLTERLEKRIQRKSLEELENEIVLFEAKKGIMGPKRVRYNGDHSGPDDKQPFMSHALFTLTKAQSTSFQADLEGQSFRYVSPNRIGHIYHSFLGPDEIDEELIGPQPYKVKVPEQKLWKLRQPYETRMDLLTTSHLEGVESVEAMCVRAIAISVDRFVESIPETVNDPTPYLIEKIV